MRRVLIALTLSLAVHAAAVVGTIGFGLWRTMSLVPSVKMEPVTIDLTKDLPLGAPPDKAEPTADQPRIRPHKARPRVAASKSQVVIPVAQDAGAPLDDYDAGSPANLPSRDGGGSVDGGRRRPGDLRRAGPEGSRLIALLRLDRVRASPDHEKTVAAVDQLLMLLPDRRVLIEGSGLDLFRDFDSLLIATPNPADAAVTFLVARHHLTESALKAGLERGAKTAAKPISWRTIDGRPVGIRQRVATSPGAPVVLDRDDRIIVLPQPSLAILATPAYAMQLLGRDVLTPPNQAKTVDAGGLDARDDGGARPEATPTRVRWSDIVARIDAEDSALPDDAVFMMTASNLFASADAPDLVVPSTRGTNEDFQMPAPSSGGGAFPQTITMMAGLDSPFIAFGADFKTTAAADQWERDLPKWKRKLLMNPMVLISGFSSLVERTQTTREGNTLDLRVESSAEEVQRLLNLATNLVRAAQASRQR